jgi:D-tyrosyl-tRNA(Tyr) deacylase
MRAVVQTVGRASVTVDGEVVGEVDDGLLVLLGVTHTDTPEIARTMARKIHELRILDDERSAADTGAGILVVS